MTAKDTRADPQFTKPIRQIILMVVALTLAMVGAFFALPRVLPVFVSNPFLNGFIALVFVLGVVACFWQVWQLVVSISWIEAYVEDDGKTSLDSAPTLLAPLVSLLRERQQSLQISSTSARSILESVAQRIDEAREITRYIVNLLIFLGLLGTFYGLATTVPAVVDTIRSLAPKDGDSGVEVFNRLMTGLESQLGGMGVAFASSLLGLSGSLVIGLLELFASHGQNRFYRELEELLSSITTFSFALGNGGDDEAQGRGDEMLRLISYMTEQTEALNTYMAEQTQSLNSYMNGMSGQTEALNKSITQSDAGRNMLETRVKEMVTSLNALCAMIQEQQETGPDAESRVRLRSIDSQMTLMVDELRTMRLSQQERRG